MSDFPVKKNYLQQYKLTLADHLPLADCYFLSCSIFGFPVKKKILKE